MQELHMHFAFDFLPTFNTAKTNKQKDVPCYLLFIIDYFIAGVNIRK